MFACLPHPTKLSNNGNMMVKRGRILFLILGSLIVINEGANIIFAFSGASENFRWFQSVLLPATMIWIVWSLWQTGDKWERWILATCMLLKGLTTLAGISFLMYNLNTVPPSEGKDILLQITSSLSVVYATYACIHVAIGLTLFLSPSVRVFLETRSQDHDEEFSF